MTPEQIKTIFERFNLKIREQEEQGEGGEESSLRPSREPADSKLKVESSAEKNVKGVEAETPNQRTPGIGLYIAQEIIEAHHGTLHIASAGMNEGTTVIVELPRGKN